MSYRVWESTAEPGCCTLVKLENVERVFELKEGVARAADFPEDARFHMDPKRPKDVKLPDQIYNRQKLLVVNGAIKALVESRSIDEIEFLPVAVVNHKGRQAEKGYWIANPLRVIDCMDLEASEFEWNDLDPDMMSSCDELVLRGDAIDPECQLFRLHHFPRIIVARGDLADALEDGDFSGVDLVTLEEFES